MTSSTSWMEVKIRESRLVCEDPRVESRICGAIEGELPRGASGEGVPRPPMNSVRRSARFSLTRT